MKSIWSVVSVSALFMFTLLLLSFIPLRAADAVAKVDQPIAPNFELTRADGQPFNLHDYAGKPVIVHFLATWYPYCKKLQPGLEKLRLECQHTDLQMIGISFNEDDGANPGQRLLDRGVGMKTLIMGDKVANLYGVRGTDDGIY
jgi:cytochrome oxidase Cu insertion factor (SCO1/SenC/PrrC family)